jgi:hypothetical protein
MLNSTAANSTSADTSFDSAENNLENNKPVLLAPRLLAYSQAYGNSNILRRQNQTQTVTASSAPSTRCWPKQQASYYH